MTSAEHIRALDSIMSLQGHNEDALETTKPVYRSYKKKYRKMRLKFDDSMRHSNDLHRMEQEANATIKRIAQFNSQMLDMLLDNNSCPQVPADKRFDIAREHPFLKKLPKPYKSELVPVQEVHKTTFAEVQVLVTKRKEQIKLAQAPKSSKSLATMLNTVPHPSSSKLPNTISSEDLAELESVPLRYLTTVELETYLDGLDSANPNALNPTLTSQEMAVRNPHSVYNWLRVNMPKVFLQDGEGSERSSAKPPALRTVSKKVASHASTPARPDNGYDDDLGEEGLEMMEGLISGNGGKSKGKRKRAAEDEDGGYHPKQGRVEDGKGKKPRKSRSKKVEDGTPGASAKRSRKPKVNTVASGEGVVIKEEATLDG